MSLPVILDELSQSDLWLFLPIGAVIALIVLALARLRSPAQMALAAAVCGGAYVLCEVLLLLLPNNYAAAFALLFIGTAALGAVPVFLLAAAIRAIRRAH